MECTADITVCVSLAIILNSVDHKEVRELQIIRYAHNVTFLYWLLDISNLGRILLSLVELKDSQVM